MTVHPRILLVAPTAHVVRTLVPILRSTGIDPVVVSDFSSAKEALNSRPELLISELKLGAFNGLHLAIRARAQGTPTLIIGEADPVLAAEAERQQARYLSALDHDRILDAVNDLLSVPKRTRRSPRKQVPLLAAFVNELPARVLDVSYEGLRLEAAQDPLTALPSHFTVRLPSLNFSCAVQRVWTAPLKSQGSERSISCGAELSMDGSDATLVWRELVDALPGVAQIV